MTVEASKPYGSQLVPFQIQGFETKKNHCENELLTLNSEK